MKREDIIAAIKENLRRADIEEEALRVQQDPYGGWQLAVVSAAFTGITRSERRQIALDGLQEMQVAWAEFLTPAEREWAGTLPGDTAPETLPLWPESLASANTRDAPIGISPSQLDDDLEPPFLATFYSLRGGVGRSTSLAYTARILAASRRKVVCVDMDLEAPGLSSLLCREEDVRPGFGVVDLLISLDQGDEPNFADFLIPARDEENLFVVPAGVPSADYARRLGLLDPSAWYREERNPLRLLLAGLKGKLPFVPDVILLDARTGINDLSGPLLFDLADLAVIVFFPHPQAHLGTELLVKGLLKAHTNRKMVTGESLAPEIRFLASPIPASKAEEVVKRYEKRTLEWIGSWLDNGRDTENLYDPDVEEVTHFVRYLEDIASTDWVSGDKSSWQPYQPIAEWIEKFLPSNLDNEGMSTHIERLRSKILNELRFSSGAADDQENFLEYFVKTHTVKDALSPNIPLVLGRKGTGKTAIYRYLDESSTHTIAVHAPRALAGEMHWSLATDGFKAIEDVIKETDLQWRHYWLLAVCIAVSHADSDLNALPAFLSGHLPAEQQEVVSTFKKVVGHELELLEWFNGLDAPPRKETLLLFDGLDAGFGSDLGGRRRRHDSTVGLFELLTERGHSKGQLRFKIMLREDLWSTLRFDNKSHLFGRSTLLSWPNKKEYFKVALKQASKSPLFLELVDPKGYLGKIDVADWHEDDVYRGWSFLAGDRMRGGKTAFTINWVWKRLADANGDRAPRYLLQLLYGALAIDQKDNNNYNKSILRSKSLIQSLETVSEEALAALSEEFDELTSLLETLKLVNRTPFETSMIATHEDVLLLAREVGLLFEHEKEEDRVIRYSVPDLYRLALKMSRKGRR